MIEDSESQEIIQIEHAARGVITGALMDNPHLKSALRKRGIFLPESATAIDVKRICAAWLGDHSEGEKYEYRNRKSRASFARKDGDDDR